MGGGVGTWLWTRHGVTPARNQRSYVELITFLLVYVAFALVSKTLTGSAIDQRVLAPMVVPAIVLFIAIVDRLWYVTRTWTALRVALSAGLVGCLVATGIWFARDAHDHGATARVLASSDLTKSPLAHAVTELEAKALVVSNYPWAISLVSHREPVVLGFARDFPGRSHRPERADELAHRACDNKVYGAYFTLVASGRTPYEATPGLRHYLKLTTIRHFPDGSLLRLVLTQTGKARCANTGQDPTRGAGRHVTQ